MKLAENTTKRQQQNIMECIVRRMKQNESNFRALLNLNDVRHVIVVGVGRETEQTGQAPSQSSHPVIYRHIETLIVPYSI